LEYNTDPSLLENSLKYASSYVVISPSLPFSSTEINLIRSFVQRGGRLAVFTDATRGTLFYDYVSGATIVTPDINAVNPLLSNFGISFNNDYLYTLSIMRAISVTCISMSSESRADLWTQTSGLLWDAFGRIGRGLVLLPERIDLSSSWRA
jgi:hypothetical protein